MNTLSRLAQKTYMDPSYAVTDTAQADAKVPNSEPIDNSDLYGVRNNPVGMEQNQIPQSAVANGDRLINGNLIVKGTVTASKLSVGERNFTSTVVFTTSYADECSWSSGVIRFLTGTDIPISSGTTGRLQQLTSTFSVDGNTLALWHMDETAGTTLDNAEGDASWDISLTNATVNQTGQFSKAVLFNGTTAYGSIADYAEMDQTVFSIEGWFKTSSTVSSTQYIVSRSYTSTSATERYYDVLITSSGKLQGIVYGFDGASTYTPYTLQSSARIDDSTWHSFAVIFDGGNDTMSLIVDGIRNDYRSDCTTNPRASAQPIYFAKSDQGTPGFFAGYLDEMRVSNSARVYSAYSTVYIYYDANVGSTLQTTLSQSTASGPQKLLLCIMRPQVSGRGADLDVLRAEGTTITGDKIVTPRIESPDGRSYLSFMPEDNRLLLSDLDTRRALFGKRL